MATEIIPAIMAKDYDGLYELVGQVCSFVPMVQIDVMDGKFVPRKSWPYQSDGQYEPQFEEILKENDALPYWQELDYEFDLMIADPEDSVDDWILGGATRLIFHVESFAGERKAEGESESVSGTARLKKFLTELRRRFPKGLTDTVATLEIGLALNTTTPIEQVTAHIDEIDFVQCMGIERIGFQGEAFDARVLAQVSALRTKFPELVVQVDGAVNLETAASLVKAGANALVAGSAIFSAEATAGAHSSTHSSDRSSEGRSSDHLSDDESDEEEVSEIFTVIEELRHAAGN